MVKKRIVSPDPPSSHKKKNSIDYDVFQRTAGMLYERFLCCTTPDFHADDDGVPMMMRTRNNGDDQNAQHHNITDKTTNSRIRSHTHKQQLPFRHHSLSTRRGGDNLMSVHPLSENPPSGFVFLEDDAQGPQQRRFPRTRSGMTSTTASVSSADENSASPPGTFFPVITASQTFDEDDDDKKGDDDEDESSSFNTCTLTPTRSNVSGSVISQSSLDYWEQPQSQPQHHDDPPPMIPSLTCLREAQRNHHQQPPEELGGQVYQAMLLHSVSPSQLARLEGYRC